MCVVFMQYPVAWSSSSSSSSLISSVCCWVRCSCRWRRIRRCLCWCCSTRRAMAAINASRGVEQQDSELRGQPGDTQHATYFWTHIAPWRVLSRTHLHFNCQSIFEWHFSYFSPNFDVNIYQWNYWIKLFGCPDNCFSKLGIFSSWKET